MNKLLSLFLIFLSLQSFSQSWEQIGPPGGYFKEFTFHPTNSSIIYAGSDDGGGVWKTVDGGTNWTLLTENFPNMTGWSITLDAINPDIIYACDVYSRYGLLKSTNGGNSWTQISNGLTSQYDRMVSGITIKNQDTLFISTGEGASTTPPRPGNGVFRSDDGGSSWHAAGLQDSTVLSIGSNEFGTIFAGTESYGLRFSNDNGATWSSHPQIDGNSKVYEIEVKDNVLAVATTSGIYLSTNWGIDFINTGLMNDFNFDIAIQRTLPSIELIATTFSGLQKYSSSDSSWNLITHPLIDNKLVIGLGAQESIMMIGTFTNSPIYRSDDNGANWIGLNNSPICTEINGLNVNPSNTENIRTCLLGTYGFSTNAECIYETMDGGNSWTRKGPLAHALCLASNPSNFNTSFVGTFAQGLFKSTDGFNTFSNVISENTIADVAISSTDTNLVLVSEVAFPQAFVKRSTDGGSTFQTVSNIAVNRLTFHSTSNDTVYAATFDGVYRSTDFGSTWSPWLLPGKNIQSLNHKNDILYAGTNEGEVFRIVNEVEGNISGNWATPIQIKSIFLADENIVVGLNGAEQDTSSELNGSLWSSSDQGQSWINITSTMTSTNIYGNNVIESTNSDLIVATYGGGIFKSNDLLLSTTPKATKSQAQISPNPSTDFIQLNAEEPIESYKIVDLSGRIILNNSSIFGDNRNFEIDISQLNAGNYTLILELEDASVSRMFHKQ